MNMKNRIKENEAVYDKYGLDIEGYNIDGFNRAGFHKITRNIL